MKNLDKRGDVSSFQKTGHYHLKKKSKNQKVSKLVLRFGLNLQMHVTIFLADILVYYKNTDNIQYRSQSTTNIGYFL